MSDEESCPTSLSESLSTLFHIYSCIIVGRVPSKAESAPLPMAHLQRVLMAERTAIEQAVERILGRPAGIKSVISL
jgi:hypothetical protein